MPNSMALVAKRVVSTPLTRTRVSRASRSTSVSIHGPMGLNVSVFLARHSVRSDFCQARSLTSLPML